IAVAVEKKSLSLKKGFVKKLRKMIRRIIIFLITVICLIGLLYSFKKIKLSQYQQEFSNSTGFPVWHGELKSTVYLPFHERKSSFILIFTRNLFFLFLSLSLFFRL